MIWPVIFIRRDVLAAELRDAVAKAFGIVCDSVLVVHAFDVGCETADIIVERTPFEGDFRTGCRIASLLSDCRLPDFLTVATALADALSTEVMASDESINPSTMYLVDGAGVVRRVSIDVEALDERGECRVLGRA